MARGGGRRRGRPGAGRRRGRAGARHAILGALLQVAHVAAADAMELRRGFMRGGDVQSLPRGLRAAAQEWKAEWRHGRRSAVEYVMGAARRIFGGAVSARRPGSVIQELAREAITYNAACP